MLEGRKKASTAIAALGISALAGSMAISSPSHAEPDIEDVQRKVQKLYHEAEQASERYNDVRVELDKTESRLAALQADVRRQRSKVGGIRDEVAASVVAQYQGQGLSSTSRVFLSDDPDAFLSQLVTVQAYNDQRGEMMADFATQLKQLEMREEAAERELDAISEAKKRLAEEKAEIDEKAGKAEDLLDRLEAEEAARVAAAAAAHPEPSRPTRDEARPTRDETRPPLNDVPASGRAGAAVDYAMAQVGDAYVYGATGPDAYDCSGLTMASWGAAGVGLTHSSGGQMGSGAPVSESQLQPGDLVFYYSPVSHVGMYIGNGQIVHAANPGTGVAVASLHSMPYSGAVRPG